MILSVTPNPSIGLSAATQAVTSARKLRCADVCGHTTRLGEPQAAQ